MEKTIFNIGDNVKVSPQATGLGSWETGYITDVSEFMRRTLVTVRYNKPDANGNTGIVLSNIGLIEKISDLK